MILWPAGARVHGLRRVNLLATTIGRIGHSAVGADVIPEPCGQCPQELFPAATKDDVLYGGAAGGGKTVGLVMEAIGAAVRYPGIRMLMLRRTYDELAESLHPEFQRIQWPAALGGPWNKTEKDVTFPHGSVIRLRYLESLEGAPRRQAAPTNTCWSTGAARRHHSTNIRAGQRPAEQPSPAP